MTEPRVFVVDDDDAVRDSVALLLETAGFSVTGFDSGESFLKGGHFELPCCLILDLRMNGMSGIDLQNALLERGVRLPIVFLTAHGDIPTTVRAVKAGAVDFLTKPVDADLLIATVHHALERKDSTSERRSSERAAGALLETLTEREREVVQLALDGHSNKEIGRILNISHRTVEFHRSRVLARTGANSLIQLASGRTMAPPAEKSGK